MKRTSMTRVTIWCFISCLVLVPGACGDGEGGGWGFGPGGPKQSDTVDESRNLPFAPETAGTPGFPEKAADIAGGEADGLTFDDDVVSGGETVTEPPKGPLAQCPEGCQDPGVPCIYPVEKQADLFVSICSRECDPQYFGADCAGLDNGAVCCGPALSDGGSKALFCVPEEGCCEQCGPICCPTATHKCIAEAQLCIPIEAMHCSGDKWCPAGEVCNDANGCCPASAPLPCGGTCCEPNQTCILGDEACIPVKSVYCGEGKFCPQGQVCTSNGCCPDLEPTPCGTGCCPAGTECAEECSLCLQPGQTVCKGCSWCDSGMECMVSAPECMPFSSTDCGNGTYCVPGEVCVDEGSGCCPVDLPMSCGDICCPGAWQCIHGQALCICPECEYCGDGKWCKVMEECLSVCNESEGSGGCCMPLGGADCMDGSYCDPGSVCVDGDKHCCPEAEPLACGDTCCPSGYECIAEYGLCLCPNCQYCGEGVFCEPGSECMASVLDCMPVGSEDCGDGTYCGPANVCVEGGQDGCCPADEPLACGTACCPGNHECKEECELCVPPDWTFCGCELLCEPGLSCMESAQQCMPSGAEDCGDGTYCGLGYVCAPDLVDSGEVESKGPEGKGCQTSEQPGCGGCPCQACVCAIDPFCCNVAWDGLCVEECGNDCDHSCGDDCQPDCNDKLCGDDGCGGICGDCVDSKLCLDGQCAMSPGTGKCCPLDTPQACGNKCCPATDQCVPDHDGGLCVPGIAEYCGDGVFCMPGEKCMQSCNQCIPEGACDNGNCQYCDPGEVCAGNGKCCPASTPKACGGTCCGAADNCYPNGGSNGNGLCVHPNEEACKNGKYKCAPGKTCMSSCDGCMPDGACDNGSCAYCGPGTVCLLNGYCCPADAPKGCGGKCCGPSDDCYPSGGSNGKGMCVPPYWEACKGGKYKCAPGKTCMSSCGGCMPDGSCDNGGCAYCGPGKVCVNNGKCCPAANPQHCGQKCCPSNYACYPNGSSDGKGLCVPPGAEACWGGQYYCGPGKTCTSSCKGCMPDGACDNGGCKYCNPGIKCGMNGYCYAK